MLLNTAMSYLKESTGLPVRQRNAAMPELPAYLAERYELVPVSAGGQPCMFVLLSEAEGFTPARFEKHLAMLEKLGAGESCCLVAPELPAYLRGRLVARQLPFMVPGQQLFWPALGAAVRKRAANRLVKPASDSLKPATQLLVLLMLNGRIKGETTASALAPLLDYTPMTLSRALDDIAQHGLAEVARKGRERVMRVSLSTRDLWERAKPLMPSPVQARVHVIAKTLPAKMRLAAGETALAQVSMLNPPAEPVYALGRKAWASIAAKLETVPVEDVGTCQVERWRYDPALLASDGRVDDFSLYLSLQHSMDERVLEALDKLGQS